MKNVGKRVGKRELVLYLLPLATLLFLALGENGFATSKIRLNAKQRANYLVAAVQLSEKVVVANVSDITSTKTCSTPQSVLPSDTSDSTTNVVKGRAPRTSPFVRLHLNEVELLKGEPLQDTLSYVCIPILGEKYPSVGERYLIFLGLCHDEVGLYEIAPGLRARIIADSAIISNPSGVLPWKDLRDSVVALVETTSFTSLAVASGLAIKGRVGNVDLDGWRWPDNKYGTVHFVVHEAYGEGLRPSPGGVVSVEIPKGIGGPGPFNKGPMPFFISGEEALLFLSRVENGNYALHGGAFSKWRVEDDLLRVERYGWPCRGDTVTLESIGLAEALEILRAGD
jgi:hypothetical protein